MDVFRLSVLDIVLEMNVSRELEYLDKETFLCVN